MHSDDEPIDPWESLRHQPWWFRLRWRFLEWRRLRAVKRLQRELNRRYPTITFD
jgi:hypothetical protein